MNSLCHLLLVEPDYSLAEAAVELFGAHGVIVSVAPDSHSAIDFVSQVQFDCVLIDVELWEGADGVELARRISRQFPKARIALSAALDSTRAIPSDIPAFQKPYRFDAVLAAFCGNYAA
ncbi:response regulator [Lysobacter soli]|uniref:response regulator n=1 Tax=Lysobacter soli TaxID=453783 RepID=UPI00209D48C2|nr:response regulator [Lysobacter soli]UTA55628.1 response regulator [Lysobacter soli]